MFKGLICGSYMYNSIYSSNGNSYYLISNEVLIASLTEEKGLGKFYTLEE